MGRVFDVDPGSTDEQAKTIDASIAAFKGPPEAMCWCRSAVPAAHQPGAVLLHARRIRAAAFADVYGGIVDAYRLNRIDFDIEGAAVADGSSALNARRSSCSSSPPRCRSLVLPVLPTGLTADGLNVVDQAVKASEARWHQRHGHGLRRVSGADQRRMQRRWVRTQLQAASRLSTR